MSGIGKRDTGVEMDALDELAAADEGNQRRQVQGGAREDEDGEEEGIGPVDGPLDLVEAGQQPTALGRARTAAHVGGLAAYDVSPSPDLFGMPERKTAGGRRSRR